MVDRPGDRPRTAARLSLLAVVAATGAADPAGPDTDLDRTAALAWPPWRAAHVLTVGVVVTGIVTATALTGDQLAPAGPVVRDATGMTGLLAGGAAALGADPAWIPAAGLDRAGLDRRVPAPATADDRPGGHLDAPNRRIHLGHGRRRGCRRDRRARIRDFRRSPHPLTLPMTAEPARWCWR